MVPAVPAITAAPFPLSFSDTLAAAATPNPIVVNSGAPAVAPKYTAGVRAALMALCIRVFASISSHQPLLNSLLQART